MVATRSMAAGGQEGANKKAKKDKTSSPSASEGGDTGRKVSRTTRGKPNPSGKPAAAKKAASKLREDESPPPTKSHEDDEKQEVRWAQPTQGRNENHRDQGEAITRFSQALFNQPWAQIWTAQRPFKFPALRTPLYTNKSGNDLTASNKPQTSPSLRRLFNLIKNTTQGNIPEAERVFTKDAFRHAFYDTNNVAAVVASRSITRPILALDGDHRIDVTVGEGDAAQTAHVHILRRSPSVGGAEAIENDYGYFIELPPNTRITVNGLTYINDNLDADVDGGVTSPFIIGPLNRYTVIELLSQPIFFFRTQANLDFTAAAYNTESRKNKPSEVEMSRRHQLSEDAVDQVEITFTPLDEQRDSSKVARPGQSATPKPPTPKPITPKKGSDIKSNYDDTWVANTDVQQYVETATYNLFRDRYRDLLPRLLSSINDRQEDEAGFSIDSDGEVQRPGRTLITTILHPRRDHSVLIIYRISEDMAITLHVLDAMAWLSTPEDRQAIHDNARQLLVDRSWWRGTFESADQMLSQFPETSYWVDCVQHVTPRHAATYAILNAFAIAMGLHLNLAFDKQTANFFDQAQLMFELLLNDQLDWKVLYAFFISTNYASRVAVVDGEAQNDDEDEQTPELPALTRRFDLRVRPYGELVAQQNVRDSSASGLRSAANIALASNNMELGVGDGYGHNTELPYDAWEQDLRENVLSRVALDGGWTLQTSQEHVEEWYREEGLAPLQTTSEQGTESSNGSNQALPGKPKSALPGLHLDYYEVSESFNPCEHFRSRMDAMSAGASIKDNLANAPVTRPLGPQMASIHILQVLRAMNEVFPAGQGFSFYDPEERILKTSLTDEMGLDGNDSPLPIDPRAYHDRVVLSPRRIGNHRVLLLFQFVLNEVENAVMIHVLDTAEGEVSMEQRQELFDSIDLMRDTDPGLPRSIMWIFGPQQDAAWQIDYFTVLNAWSILLGLDLNPYFSLEGKPEFFTDVRRLLIAANAGQADWKLIWAFLRCSNYVRGTEPPPPDRRFTRTIPMTDLVRYRQVIDGRERPPHLFEDRACYHPKLDGRVGLRHDVDFPEDERPKKYPATKVPAPIPTGKSGGKLPEVHSDRQKRNLGMGLAKDFDPCSYFHDTRDRILDERKADLDDFREREKATCTTKFRKWLDDTETSLSVAAVTMAITQMQGVRQGFSFVSAHEIAMCMAGESWVLDAFRPGRPMVLPLNIDMHYILLIIRVDEHGRPEFSVMDSKPYYLGSADRERVHDMMFRLLMATNWYRHWSDKGRMGASRPPHTSWLPSSIQPSDDECGYYVILNAWSMVMGLETNPDVCLDWSDDFFRDLQDVIHIARIGRASWQLIYAFLRCYGYVKEGQVPLDRRFELTAELRNEAGLFNFLDEMRSLEQVEFSMNGLPSEELRTTSILRLPTGGRSHNDANAFSSDEWDDDTRDLAIELGRRGKLNMSHTEAQVEEAIREARKERSRTFMEQLRTSGVNYSKDNRNGLLDFCRDYLSRWHSQHENVLQAAPCELSLDTIRFYDAIFDQENLGETLSGDAFRVWPKQPAQLQKEMVTPMDQVEVNLPISAVVEAIDRLQADAHDRNTGRIFAGGFSLTTSFKSESAMPREMLFDDVGVVSRPRRCFLWPLYIGESLESDLRAFRTKEGIDQKRLVPGSGHHLLAVVQEEPSTRPGGSEFNTYFCDSSRHVFEDAQDFLGLVATRAAGRLGWSRHRNNSVILFGTYDDVNVPQQARGGAWRCGPHTIINAWILAMGLTPNPEAQFSDDIYAQLRTLAKAAVAGLLDWQTLVAWLFCAKLTVERSLHSVSPDRRFTTTHFWENEARMDERIDEIRLDDDALAFLRVDEMNYDYGNNISVPDESSEGVNDESEESDEEDDDDSEDGLTRQFEEVDLPYDRLSRKRRSTIAPTGLDALTFLNGYDVDTDGDAIMSDQDLGRRNGDVDKLLFLEGF